MKIINSNYKTKTIKNTNLRDFQTGGGNRCIRIGPIRDGTSLTRRQWTAHEIANIHIVQIELCVVARTHIAAFDPLHFQGTTALEIIQI